MKYFIILFVTTHLFAMPTPELLLKDQGTIWSLETSVPGIIYFTERERQFKKFDLKTKKVEEISIDFPVVERGQGGLLDVLKHPRQENVFYFSATVRENLSYTLAVYRSLLKNNKLESKEIFRAKNESLRGQHFGSRLVMDDNNNLFITMGDRGDRDLAQDLNAYPGSIFRLKEDGSIPKDNPFVGKAGLDEIWSYGHRNPQGLTFHPETKVLWSTEHGPKGGDEINIIKKGANYGWPVVSFGKEYMSGRPVSDKTSAPGMEGPLYQYTPSIATSGMTFVSSDRYPAWKGHLLIGSLVLTHLSLVKIKGEKIENVESLYSNLERRIRDVKQAADGFVYFSTDEGEIYRLNPSKNPTKD